QRFSANYLQVQAFVEKVKAFGEQIFEALPDLRHGNVDEIVDVYEPPQVAKSLCTAAPAHAIVHEVAWAQGKDNCPWLSVIFEKRTSENVIVRNHASGKGEIEAIRLAHAEPTSKGSLDIHRPVVAHVV